MGTRRSKHNKGRKRISARDLHALDARTIERAERRAAPADRPTHAPMQRPALSKKVIAGGSGRVPTPKPALWDEEHHGPLYINRTSERHNKLEVREEKFDLSRARGRWLQLSDIQSMNEDDAREAFTALRWAQGAICPYCGWDKVYHISSRRNYKCGKCGRQFSETTRTFFSSRKLPFKTILLALAILKNGSNTHRLHFDIGVTYKTALDLTRRVNSVLDLPPAAPLLRHSPKDTMYPYIVGRANEGAELLLAVNEAVPRGLPEDIRAEVCQDILVALLSGEIDIGEMQSKSKGFIKKVWKLFPSKYGPISLDAPPPWLRDSKTPLVELLDSEMERWTLA